MSHSRTHQARLARRLSKEAGIGYQQALARVQAAARAGTLPAVFDDAGMSAALTVLVHTLDSPTAPTTRPGALTVPAALRTCIWCGAKIDPTLASSLAGEETGEGTVDDPHKAGDWNNVCIVCSWDQGLPGTPDPADGWQSPTAHLEAILALLAREGRPAYLWRQADHGMTTIPDMVVAPVPGEPYEYAMAFSSADGLPPETTDGPAEYVLGMRDTGNGAEDFDWDDLLTRNVRWPGPAARTLLTAMSHLPGGPDGEVTRRPGEDLHDQARRVLAEQKAASGVINTLLAQPTREAIVGSGLGPAPLRRVIAFYARAESRYFLDEGKIRADLDWITAHLDAWAERQRQAQHDAQDLLHELQARHPMPGSAATASTPGDEGSPTFRSLQALRALQASPEHWANQPWSQRLLGRWSEDLVDAVTEGQQWLADHPAP